MLGLIKTLTHPYTFITVVMPHATPRYQCGLNPLLPPFSPPLSRYTISGGRMVVEDNVECLLGKNYPMWLSVWVQMDHYISLPFIPPTKTNLFH